MSFTTLTFALFFPLVFTVYWLVRGKVAQNTVVIIASYIFYGWWDWRFCFLLLASTLWDYFLGLAIERAPMGSARRRHLLVASVSANLALLGVFKYYNFFAASFADLMHAVGWHADLATLNVILPVGISFYTFQSLSYTIDIYRGKVKPTTHLLDYTAFVAFFPQLVAGPIERASHLLPLISQPRVFAASRAAEGCRFILWGLFKKMAIADNLALSVNAVYSDPSAYSGPQLVIATVMFAGQIYCDFSGYTDIALGTARLLGIELMRNFALPYFSQSVGEFWRRWHISLSTWFRDYLYIPLGGSRVAPARRVANILITFVISGLWHGASWNFAIWGFANGLGILPEALSTSTRPRLTATDPPGGTTRWWPGSVALLKMALCFAWICLTWVFFRAATLHDAASILATIARDLPHLAAHRHGLMLGNDRNLFILPVTLLVVLVEWGTRTHPHPLHLAGWPRPLRWLVYTVLFWALLLLMPMAQGAFIYFQF